MKEFVATSVSSLSLSSVGTVLFFSLDKPLTQVIHGLQQSQIPPCFVTCASLKTANPEVVKQNAMPSTLK